MESSHTPPEPALSEPSSLPDVSRLRIRRMRDEDTAGILPIESVSFGRQHWSPESFRNEMNNPLGRYYVFAEAAQDAAEAPCEQIIGYCGLWVVIDEAHITTLAVHPQRRGQHLGELLFSHCLDRLMGQVIHVVTLEVRASNTGAQALYQKYGFEVMGVRPRYYQDTHEDALIMSLNAFLGEENRKRYAELKQALMQKFNGALPQGFGLP